MFAEEWKENGSSWRGEFGPVTVNIEKSVALTLGEAIEIWRSLRDKPVPLCGDGISNAFFIDGYWVSRYMGGTWVNVMK